ncbi:MAG TPA: PP2C family protein-serine/threonine phosphatase [Bacteroidia bacterium]|nr:PP2C family protein-serine/threonine phosphatase [Bacteroidia bacterium]
MLHLEFYWSATLNNGNFALATADSTGHGVPGAIMSLLNITSLEKAIETESSPDKILNATRKIIIDRLKKDGSAEGGKDGMDCSLCVFDFKNNKLFVANANNPVWIVRNTDTEALEVSTSTTEASRTSASSVIEIKADKMPVGKHDKQVVPFTLKEYELQKGDIVYTLTDGFPDQFGGEKGKKFMSKNLRELLVANSHLPMQEQRSLLEKTFKDWVGDLEQVDDVTVIGIRI